MPTFHTLGFNISLTPSYPQIQTAQINPGELPTVISYLGLGTTTQHSDHPCGDDWVSAVGGFIGPRLVTSSSVLFSTCTRQICRTGEALPDQLNRSAKYLHGFTT
ncbi:hypothetical protein Agabi119p4_8605 [Agaricus bisporus var. burnettii]|uniref:Uncharacterized protein n=1 Tax=Agaricus bisporus var. burnettii TaxID=192524 RepID=A0A8H7EYL2_AGABI|nr:hypothetical protein Agabi119p4_8605 [Agaricus bisporus var. burnettii]